MLAVELELSVLDMGGALGLRLLWADVRRTMRGPSTLLLSSRRSLLSRLRCECAASPFRLLSLLDSSAPPLGVADACDSSALTVSSDPRGEPEYGDGRGCCTRS